MKILHVMTGLDPKWGGVYRVLLGLVNVQKRNNEVAILTTCENDRQPPKDISGVRQTCLKIRSHYQFSFRMKQTIENLIPQYELVHIHGLWMFPLSYAAACARRANIPYVYHIHGMLNPWPLKHHAIRKQIYAQFWERSNLNHAVSIICVTQHEERSVQAFHVAAPTTIIPNGIDLSELENLSVKGRFRSKHPEIAQKFLVLFLGRIHPKKGIDLLIKGFHKFFNRFHQTQLLIAGPEEDKNYAKNLKKLVADYRLEKAVTFLGSIFGEEKKELLVDANLFALPSHDEVLSIALLEAMASGLPVVATQECSFDEIESKQAGFLIRYDENELAQAMIRIAGDEWMANRMGINGKNLILARYNWDVIGKQIETLYQEVLQTHSRS